MTGSSSSSRPSVVGSSKRDARRQQGFPTRVKSWAGSGESWASSDKSGCSSPKRDPNVRHGTPFHSGEQDAQGQCRVDSPVTWLIYKIRNLHRCVPKGHGFRRRIPSAPRSLPLNLPNEPLTKEHLHGAKILSHDSGRRECLPLEPE